MTKITALLVAAAAFASVGASAGTVLSGNKVTQAQCTLLQEDTNVNTSKGVVAAFNCSTTTNTIAFGACHESGSRKETEVNCAQTGTDDKNQPIWNDTSCKTTSDKFKIANFKGYVVSNAGGAVGPVDLGTSCDKAGTAIANKVK